MAESGIKFDYDLMANKFVKEKDICIVCGESLRCRWTDMHGEGVCMVCGMSYQLMHGNKEQEEEGDYPYCNIKDEWIPVCREYWEETKQFCFGGRSFSEDTGRKEFNAWVELKHPELIKAEE